MTSPEARNRFSRRGPVRLAGGPLVSTAAGGIVNVASACASGTEPDRSADARTPIQLPLEARDLVLVEMRTMLGSVHGVPDGAVRSISWLTITGLMMPIGILAEVTLGVPPIFVLVGGVGMVAATVWLAVAVVRSRAPAR